MRALTPSKRQHLGAPDVGVHALALADGLHDGASGFGLGDQRFDSAPTLAPDAQERRRLLDDDERGGAFDEPAAGGWGVAEGVVVAVAPALPMVPNRAPVGDPVHAATKLHHVGARCGAGGGWVNAGGDHVGSNGASACSGILPLGHALVRA
jgi:hypothetical protein